MKTIQQIKKKIQAMQIGKAHSSRRGDDPGYRAYIKAEKVLKWVLED